MKFKGGEWIEVVNFDPNMDGAICYVKAVKTYDLEQTQELFVVAVRHKEKGPFNGQRWFWDHNCLLLQDQISQEDIDSLIDLALAFRDEDLFDYATNL